MRVSQAINFIKNNFTNKSFLDAPYIKISSHAFHYAPSFTT